MNVTVFRHVASDLSLVWWWARRAFYILFDRAEMPRVRYTRERFGVARRRGRGNAVEYQTLSLSRTDDAIEGLEGVTSESVA